VQDQPIVQQPHHEQEQQEPEAVERVPQGQQQLGVPAVRCGISDDRASEMMMVTTGGMTSRR
jgi:hypothetical protein